MFEDVEITLRSTVMAFITMNPGYPGACAFHAAELRRTCRLLACRCMCGWGGGGLLPLTLPFQAGVS